MAKVKVFIDMHDPDVAYEIVNSLKRSFRRNLPRYIRRKLRVRRRLFSGRIRVTYKGKEMPDEVRKLIQFYQ